MSYKREDLEIIDEAEALAILFNNPYGYVQRPFVAYFKQNYLTYGEIIDCETLKADELLEIMRTKVLYTQKRENKDE
jgi:hypothetical protein